MPGPGRFVVLDRLAAARSQHQHPGRAAVDEVGGGRELRAAGEGAGAHDRQSQRPGLRQPAGGKDAMAVGRDPDLRRRQRPHRRGHQRAFGQARPAAARHRRRTPRGRAARGPRHPWRVLCQRTGLGRVRQPHVRGLHQPGRPARQRAEQGPAAVPAQLHLPDAQARRRGPGLRALAAAGDGRLRHSAAALAAGHHRTHRPPERALPVPDPAKAGGRRRRGAVPGGHAAGRAGARRPRCHRAVGRLPQRDPPLDGRLRKAGGSLAAVWRQAIDPVI